MADDLVPMIMEEVTDPAERAEARARRVRFDRNWAWFLTQIPGLHEAHRGQCICVSGEEVFAADTAEAVLALARAAHPEDDGRFTLYVPRDCLHAPTRCR